ncbi:MAG: hypothetical protein Tsb0020_05620 [Haliangiales bacterium]
MYRWVAICALVCLIGGPLSAYVGVAPALVGFGIFALAGLLGALAVVLGVVGLVRKRGAGALFSLVVGALCVACLLVPAIAGRGYPPINDISTDLVDPPPLNEVPTYPQAFVPIVSEHYPDLASLRFEGVRPQLVFDEALRLAQERPAWSIHTVDQSAKRFEGTAETRLFRFHDDIAVRVRVEDGETLVDMRSRSRDGKGDLGANANRIRAFFVDLNARLAARTEG